MKDNLHCYLSISFGLLNSTVFNITHNKLKFNNKEQQIWIY